MPLRRSLLLMLFRFVDFQALAVAGCAYPPAHGNTGVASLSHEGLVKRAELLAVLDRCIEPHPSGGFMLPPNTRKKCVAILPVYCRLDCYRDILVDATMHARENVRDPNKAHSYYLLRSVLRLRQFQVKRNVIILNARLRFSA